MDTARTRIVVVDDASPEADRRSAAVRLKGAELVLAEQNGGYAASVNRGLELARPDEDVVVLNNDITPHSGWLVTLQMAAYEDGRGGHRGVAAAVPRRADPVGRAPTATWARRNGSTTATGSSPRTTAPRRSAPTPSP